MKDRKNRRHGFSRWNRHFAWLLSLTMLMDCLPASALAQEPEFLYSEEGVAENGAEDSYQEDSYQEEVPQPEEIQPVHEHNYVAYVTDPTCTESGYTYYECECGDSYTEPGAGPLGHMWDDGVVTVAPSAGAEGVMTYTCIRGGETYEEPIPALQSDGGAGDNNMGAPGQADNQNNDGGVENVPENSGQDETAHSDSGLEENIPEGSGQDETAYSDSGLEENVPDDSGQEEDQFSDDGPEEVSINGLFQEVDYMPGADTTYTALWEEEVKEPALIDEDPQAKELVYNGEPQILIDGGSAVGGTLLYALGDSYDTAPEYGYSEDLPEGLEAGDYYLASIAYCH